MNTKPNEPRLYATVTTGYIPQSQWTRYQELLKDLRYIRGFYGKYDGRTTTITTVVTENQALLDTAELLLGQLAAVPGVSVTRHLKRVILCADGSTYPADPDTMPSTVLSALLDGDDYRVVEL